VSTNLALDDQLIESAKLLGNHRSKKDAVTVALEQAILDEFGKVDYDPKYSYKKQRKVA
jgi:hypothetical protein